MTTNDLIWPHLTTYDYIWPFFFTFFLISRAFHPLVVGLGLHELKKCFKKWNRPSHPLRKFLLCFSIRLFICPVELLISQNTMDQFWLNFRQCFFNVSFLHPQKHSIVPQKLWPQNKFKNVSRFKNWWTWKSIISPKNHG